MAGSNFENTKTEFNSNLLRIIALNDILDNCNNFYLQTNMNGYSIAALKSWKDCIRLIYKEIYPKMNLKEREHIKNMFTKYYAECPDPIIVEKTKHGTKKKLNSTAFMKHKTYLEDIEFDLRDIANKHGMLITDKDTGWNPFEDD
jgi:hypothetical protein